MLTSEQINEIREHLEKAQNPLFFFDNDNDGLMSFLLLRRFINRGRGVVVKGSHNLSKNYFRRIDELNPDYVFILDLPRVEKDFLEKVNDKNLPVVWIDHHDVDCKELKDSLASHSSIDYYNPYHNDKTNEPVAYLCYKIANQEKDMWLALIGCVSDYYIPDFYNEFEKKYPELSKKNPKNGFDIFYGSEIGRIARILDFSLKDTTTNVINMLRFMMRVKGPLDILEENHKTKRIFQRYEQINEKYQKIMKKARESVGQKMIYFQYGGDLSLSSNLSNQIKHEFSDKFIVVVYVKEDIANISVRGDNAKKFTLEAIKNIEGAVGGGHEKATGARMNVDSLPEFKKKMKSLVGED